MTAATARRAGGADEILLGFARALRAAGVPVTADRDAAFLAAAATGRRRRPAARPTGPAGPRCAPARTTSTRYDQVFAAWFDAARRAAAARPRDAAAPAPRRRSPTRRRRGERRGADEADVRAGRGQRRPRCCGTATWPTLSAAPSRPRLAALFATLRPRRPRGARRRAPPLAPRRRRRPPHPARAAAPDGRAGRHRAGGGAAPRPRRVVLLVDVSGSMSAVRRRAAAPRPPRGAPGAGRRSRSFTLGTRLTRVTRAMRLRDPERALVAAGETVPDWSGGTRLGEALRAFLDRWGQRGMARGAVVVIFSDGWERGDAALLGEQMHGCAGSRTGWCGSTRTGARPATSRCSGASSPRCRTVDDFVAGHSLATFAELLEVVARA